MLGAAFIPVFAGFIDRNDRERASRLASSMLTWTGLGILVLSAIAYVLASPLTHLVAPGYDAYTHDLTVELMRPLLLSPVFLGLAIACKGILEAQNQFAWPAFAPVLYNLAIIIAAFFFADEYGIHAVVWGASSVFPAPQVRKRLLYPEWIDLNRRSTALWMAFTKSCDCLVRVIGLAAFQLNFIFVSAFASILGAQYVSGLNYAWLLLMLPHGARVEYEHSGISVAGCTVWPRRYRRIRQLFDRTMRPALPRIPASVALVMVGAGSW